MRPQWAEALRLACLGLPVFPLPPNSKAPNTRAATYKTATTDEEQIRAWAKEFPDHNYGVFPSPGRALILDLDVKGDGEASFASLEIENSIVPYFLKVRTPSGGLHLYVWLPEGHPVVKSTIRKLGPGIDTKCDSGHVVGPRCNIDGAPYEILDEDLDEEPCYAPDWLLDACGEGTTRPEGDRPPACDELDAPQAVDAALDYVERQPIVEEGARNDTSYKVTCRVRDFGISREQCLEMMIKAYNKRKCLPPLEPDEVAAVVESAYQRAQNTLGVLADTSAFDDVRPTVTETETPASDENPLEKHIIDGVTALAREKDPTWLVDQTIIEGNLAMIYGLHSAFKSIIGGMDLALSVATGTPWLSFKTRPVNVLYIAGEGQVDLKPRALAWCEARGLEYPENVAFLKLAPPFSDPAYILALEGVIRARASKLVIIDTMTTVTAGMEENQQKDMSLFTVRLAELRLNLKCTIVLIHHSTKRGDSARGSGVVINACDHVLQFKALGGLKARISMTKARGEAWEKAIKVVGRKVGGAVVFKRDHVVDKEDETELLTSVRIAQVKKELTRISPETVVTELLLDAITDTETRSSFHNWLRKDEKGKKDLAGWWVKDVSTLRWGTEEALGQYIAELKKQAGLTPTPGDPS